MRGPYPGELRVRVIRFVEGGGSRREAAEQFDVSVSSAIRWLQRFLDDGTCEPMPRGGSTVPHWEDDCFALRRSHGGSCKQRGSRKCAKQLTGINRVGPAGQLVRWKAAGFDRPVDRGFRESYGPSRAAERVHPNITLTGFCHLNSACVAELLTTDAASFAASV